MNHLHPYEKFSVGPDHFQVKETQEHWASADKLFADYPGCTTMGLKYVHVGLGVLIPTSPHMKKSDHSSSLCCNISSLPSVLMTCWCSSLIWQYDMHQGECTLRLLKYKLLRSPHNSSASVHCLLQCSSLGAITLWLMSAFLSSPCSDCIFPHLWSLQLPLLPISSVIAHALRCGWGTLVLCLKSYQQSNSCQFDLMVLISLGLCPGFVSYGAWVSFIHFHSYSCCFSLQQSFCMVWLIPLVLWLCGPSYGVVRSFVVWFSFTLLIATYLCFHISLIIPL